MNARVMPDAETYTMREAADLLGCSRSTLYSASDRGCLDTILVYRRGESYLGVEKNELMRWWESRQIVPRAPRTKLDPLKLSQRIDEKVEEDHGGNHSQAARSCGFGSRQWYDVTRNLRLGRGLPNGSTLFAILLWLDTPLEELKADG
jgi:excisionase family DNA binding protein